MESDDVKAAMELAFNAVRDFLDELKRLVSSAAQEGEYEKVRRLTDKCERVEQFLKKVEQLSEEWQSLSVSSMPVGSPTVAIPQTTVRRRRANRQGRRLTHGLKTPEKRFRRPILEALVELGGSAAVSDVLSLVAKKLQGVLNQYDWAPLPSGREVRWRNTAKWCRRTMVEEGLLLVNSPKGIWEISEAGRKALESGEV